MPIIKIKKPIIALLIFNIAINGLNFFNIPESKANNEEIQAQASVEYQNEIESIQSNFENEFEQNSLKNLNRNWTKINWDLEVYLPKEQKDFQEEIKKLTELEKFNEIQNLQKPQQYKLRDPKALEANFIPYEIREVVKNFPLDRNLTPDEKEQIRINLIPYSNFETNQSTIFESEEAAQNAQKIEFDKLKPINPENIIWHNNTKNFEVTVNSKPNSTASTWEDRNPFKFEIIKPDNWTTPTEISQSRSTFDLIPKAHAQIFSNPIIQKYAGIEEHPIEVTLLNLIKMQNPDGSFGEINKFENTIEIIHLLARYKRVNNDQYLNALNYISATTPTNTREKAIKIRVLHALGQNYQSLLNEVVQNINSDGGYSIEPNRESDLITSLQVSTTLHSINPNHPNLPALLLYITAQIPQDGGVKYQENSNPSYYLISKTAEHLAKFRNKTIQNQSGTVSIKIQDKIDTMTGFLKNNYDSWFNELKGTNSENELEDKAHVYYVFWGYEIEKNSQKILRKELFHFHTQFSGWFEMERMITGMKFLAQSDLTVSDFIAKTDLINGSDAVFEFKLKNIGYANMDQAALINFVVDNYSNGVAVSCDDEEIFLEPNQEAVVTVNFSKDFTNSYFGDTEFKILIKSDNEYNYEDNWYKKNFKFADNTEGKAAIQSFFVVNNHELNDENTGYTTVPSINARWIVKPDPRRLAYLVLVREKGTIPWYEAALNPNWNGAFLYMPNTEDKTYQVTVGVLYENKQTNQTEALTFANPVELILSSDRSKYTSSFEGHASFGDEKAIGIKAWTYGDGFKTSGALGDFKFENTKHGQNAIRVSEDHLEAIHSDFAAPLFGSTKDIEVITRLKDDTEKPEMIDLFINGSAKTSKIVKNKNSFDIVLVSKDNVSIQEAEIELFNPAINNFELIEISSLPNTTEGSIRWHIKPEYIGPDFKLRARVKDFRDNYSQYMEWGPFEIKDGTLPTGTIAIDSMPESAGIWSLGQTKTISWNINSANPLKSIETIKLIGPKEISLATNFDPSKSNFQFAMPLSSSYTGNDYQLEIKVCDINDNCNKITSTQKFNIVDQTPKPHKPWEEPKFENAIIKKPNTIYWIKKVIQKSNEIEVLYTEQEGVSYESPGATNRLIYRKFTSGNWQNPIVVSSHTYDRNTMPESASISFEDVEAHKATNGDIHIAYTEFHNGGDISNFDLNEVFYTKISNNSIATNKKLSSDTVSSETPKIMVNSQNKVYLAWRNGYKFSSNSGFNSINLIEGDGNQTWTSTKDFAWSIGSFIINLENEKPLFVYGSATQLHIFRQNTDNSWTTPITIKNPKIAKSHFQNLTADQSKLNLILIDNPNNSEEYLWLDSIQKYADLLQILENNSFTHKNEILSIWSKENFNYTSRSWHIFPKTNDQYDFFFINNNATQSRNMHHLELSLDYRQNNHRLESNKQFLKTGNTEYINDMQVLKNSQGLYHVFYLHISNQPNYFNRPFHGIYDGNEIYFISNITSKATQTGEKILGTSNENDFIKFFIEGNLQQGFGLISNQANYSPIIENRLKLISPENLAETNENQNFIWNFNQNSTATYEVFFGEDLDFMQQIASNITETQFPIPTLHENSTYYWQVIATTQSGAQIFSNPGRFITKNFSSNQPEIDITNNSTHINSGDKFEYGEVIINQEKDIEFIITNKSSGELKLINTPKISITPSSYFIVLKEPTSPINENESSNFIVRFQPTSQGKYTATLTLQNNDIDESSYIINLEGNGRAEPTSIIYNAEETNPLSKVPAENIFEENGNKTYQDTKTKTIFTSEFIEIDPQRNYELSGKFKSQGTDESMLYYGIATYDKDKKFISSLDSNTEGNQVTIENVNSTQITTKENIDKWISTTKPNAYAGWRNIGFYFDGNSNKRADFILSNYQTFNSTAPEDGAYSSASDTTIQLNKELPQEIATQIIPGTTIIKNHRTGASYLYTAAENKQIPKSWTELKSSITDIGFKGLHNQFRPGTKYIKLLLLTNFNQANKSTSLLYDDLKFAEIEETTPAPPEPTSIIYNAEETNPLSKVPAENIFEENGNKTYQDTKTKTIFTSEFIEIDPQRNYELSGKFKSQGTDESMLYYGIATYDKDKKFISSLDSNTEGNQVTIENVNSTQIITKENIDKWISTTKPNAYAGWRNIGFYFDGNSNKRADFILSNYQTFNSTAPEDGAYSSASDTTIQLNKELPQEIATQIIPGTTIIKNHRTGASYLYTAAENKQIPKSWTELKSSITDIGFKGLHNQFRPGTKYIKLLLLTNFNQANKSTSLLYDDLKFAEIEE